MQDKSIHYRADRRGSTRRRAAPFGSKRAPPKRPKKGRSPTPMGREIAVTLDLASEKLRRLANLAEVRVSLHECATNRSLPCAHPIEDMDWIRDLHHRRQTG